MVFLHLPWGGGNGHRIMHAAAFYTAPTEGPGAPGGRPTIPNPSPFCFAALPRSDALSPLPACPILCGRIIAGDQHDPSGTPRPLWTAATRYSPNVGAGKFYELRL
jgi:hypothetical protein